MIEKGSLPETENPCSEPTTAESARPTEFKNDATNIKVNGGLKAWLSVLALFCVFINSW